MKTTKTILVLAFLLLMPLTLAAQEDEVELFVSGEIDIDFENSGSSIDYALSKFYFFPEDSYRQKVIRLDTQPEYSQKGNSIVFRWENPGEGKLLYGVNSVVEITDNFPKIKTKVKYPLTDLGGFEEYTKPSELIDSDFPGIKTKADSIYGGSDDLFVVVSDIATWINDNIEYDWSYVAEVEKASWVLTNKRGTCDEFSTLMIAIARDMGIPAKYVYGMSYADIPQFEGYGQHAWVEIYFPGYGWVPFDPSYNQLGYLDTSHIKLKESIDPNRIRTEFEWRATDVDVMVGDLNFKANLRRSEGEREIPYSMKIRVVKKKIGFGSSNLIELEVKNLEDYYISEEFLLVGTEETKIEEFNKRIVLEPNEIKRLYWNLELESDLNPKLNYEFPLAVYTARNESISASFEANKKADVYSIGDIDAFQELVENGQEIPEEEVSFLDKIINWFKNLFQ